MSHELYKRFRPTELASVYGQNTAVKTLEQFFTRGTVPHALLFSGDSGCGKTTLARIVASELKCSDMDFEEVNAAKTRGIDSIREIEMRMRLAPLKGKVRVWLLDEAHKLTGDAQTALLKMMEDTPNHVYFMLATTEPNKIIPTLRNRCTVIPVKKVSQGDLCSLVTEVCEAEKVDISEDVTSKIAEAADGSPRRALVLLEQVMYLESEQDQLEAINKADSEKQAIEIARALFKGVNWPVMAKLLKEVDEEPETVRRVILGYMNTIMLGGNPKPSKRAFSIIEVFRDNFFDSGKAGLTAACYEIVGGP